ncbi:MAG: hypothetical protein A2406_02905 [Candidatus Komeilibacteria bacterium RIFOXYC1_FULL_37_11]|uniref:Disease resistance R13L4/SHOC-2-like LRR domain-containing protein n=1 Tax=Candidatus Komeilibacteria bacterium RIFOXYC1_FULL_37_11 TaxID=1798555 RepID=A0A1G2C0I5_9BACT|nr:MAG: hypothetical protein A2406_02905 [Candidatus Komeilibacteria bacterium RIFOXYC1_FULL_37_11]OGY95684.1 MAG: hypothetical protein A2611_02790 [Candidatus Komeilibacteria bacterium RIFOXYD1_FULL_37_29]
MKNIVFILAISLLLSGCSLIRSVPKIEPNTQSPDGINTNSPAPVVTVKDSLDLSGQGLSQVDQSVFKQSNLRQLDVSDNQLTGALPAEIRQLQNLQILRATNNQMTGVPAEIGQLSNLIELDLSNNQLTGLPYELGNLKNLKILNLSGNNVSQYDLDIIRQSLSADVNIIMDSQQNVAVIYCQPEQRQAEVCTTIYSPVCATVNIQCIKAPCDPIKETFSNSCVACQNSLVESYVTGEC